MTKVFGYTIAATILGFILVMFLGTLGVIGNVLSAPGRVVNRTLETDNIIQNYELFHDLHQGHQARVSQIQEFEALADGADADEVNRIRIDLAAVRQSCRNIVTEYNANSEKINRAVFKRGANLPYRLELMTCE